MMNEATTSISSSIVAPNQILVSHYLYEREKEVKTVIEVSTSRKRAFQIQYEQLGKKKQLKRPVGRVHYRTRSHKRYKFPRKLISKKRKRDNRVNTCRCRKHRRRPAAFRPGKDDIETSKPKKLPTHNWHVKRFQMERNYFGCQVPIRRSSKGLKTLERVVTEKSIVHDYSYLEAIFVDASLEAFSQFLLDHSDPNSKVIRDIQNGGKRLTNGMEYDLLIYQKGRFPDNLVGPISITVKLGSSLQIICWLHPAIRNTIWEILQSRTEPDHFTVVEKMPLTRFWLSGANISSILSSLYHPMAGTVEAATTSTATVTGANNTLPQDISQGHDGYSFLYHCIQDQRRLQNTWKSGQVLSLSMRDPRLNPKRSPTPSPSETPEKPKTFQWPKGCSDSSLWTKDKLEEVMAKAPSDGEVQAILAKEKFQKWNSALQAVQQYFGFDLPSATRSKSSCGPSGLRRESLGSSTSIPLVPSLLIRKSVACSNHSISIPDTLRNDWIIIIPRCYAASVFQRFVTRDRVESLGLEEMLFISRLQTRLTFPNDYPDCVSGWNYWQDIYYQKWITKEMKKPPAKRISIHSSIISTLPEIIDQREDDCNEDIDENDDEERRSTDHNVCGAPSEAVVGPMNRDKDNSVVEVVADEEKEKGKEIRELFSEKFLIVREKQYIQEMLPPRYQYQPDNAEGTKKGIFHCLQHRDWQIPEDVTSLPTSPENEELIPAIPPTPKPIFVFITIFPTSRGLPLTGSSLYQPTFRDLRDFMRHRVHLKLRYLQLQSKKERLSNPLTRAQLPTSLPLSRSQTKKAKKEKREQHTQQSLFAVEPSHSSATDFSYDPEMSCEWRGVSDSDGDNVERVLLGVITNGFPSHSNTNAFHHRSVAIALVHLPRLHAMIRHYYGRFSSPLSHQLLLFQTPTSDWLRPALYDFL